MISCIQLKTVLVTFKTVKTNIKTVYILDYQGNDDGEY